MAAIFAARGMARRWCCSSAQPKAGRKILISGGGRCNILPARLDETRFVSDSSPNSLRKIVRSWPLAEQIAFFNGELGLALVEETGIREALPCLEPRARRTRWADRARRARRRAVSREHDRHGHSAARADPLAVALDDRLVTRRRCGDRRERRALGSENRERRARAADRAQARPHDSTRPTPRSRRSPRSRRRSPSSRGFRSL